VIFGKKQVEHAKMLVPGLLSASERKHAESIAYLFGQERMPLQHFLGISEWDDKPLRCRAIGTGGPLWPTWG
jgi:SRSO17 transposase